jgi:hypothetical protein
MTQLLSTEAVVSRVSSSSPTSELGVDARHFTL